MTVARRTFSGARFDDDTQFVAKVLDWVLEERANGRLVVGAPITLVLHDFRPSPIEDGAKVDLHNGEAVAGAVHLCNQSLRRANVALGATGLNTVHSHQKALATHQLASRTSVTFNPVTTRAYVRLACLPLPTPVEMTLAGQLDAAWAAGLSALPASLDAFHLGMTKDDGIGRLFFENGAPRPHVRTNYRNAIYLFLKYQVGVRDVHGYRMTTNDRLVRISKIGSASSVAITAICPGVGDPAKAGAAAARALADADARLAKDDLPTHVTCMNCPSGQAADVECATPPTSLRHRHVEAA
ncbi:hypothetical protein QLH51_14255 [Sphingomonas sp. 2R-10]|uniref:hypothetical protein n=1 Tax=Sphingomonas sp. 2R-10 TaxID=3045148 RepID=UPI000F796346|nr:hypothetical protein [Sphingomonas sp. 2R-10]MDJ0277961.1 hypothetical protein [Sphingomonas sp. 2R-10]